MYQVETVTTNPDNKLENIPPGYVFARLSHCNVTADQKVREQPDSYESSMTMFYTNIEAKETSSMNFS